MPPKQIKHGQRIEFTLTRRERDLIIQRTLIDPEIEERPDFQRFFRVTPPVVHQMIKTLHAHGFIDREPGKARTIRLRLTRAELPDLD